MHGWLTRKRQPEKTKNRERYLAKKKELRHSGEECYPNLALRVWENGLKYHDGNLVLRDLSCFQCLFTCISLSDTFARCDPSADFAEFCGLMYRFCSTIVWENVGLLWILEQKEEEKLKLLPISKFHSSWSIEIRDLSLMINTEKLITAGC